MDNTFIEIDSFMSFMIGTVHSPFPFSSFFFSADLSPRNRIKFYIPEGGDIECKIALM